VPARRGRDDRVAQPGPVQGSADGVTQSHSPGSPTQRRSPTAREDDERDGHRGGHLVQVHPLLRIDTALAVKATK